MTGFVWIVPCFDEEKRLEAERWRALAEGGRGLLFVNDGSRDGTARMLASMREKTPSLDVLDLSVNGGKAEAVRQGFLHVLSGRARFEARPHWLGFADADLATPPGELVRLEQVAEGSTADAVLASRVRLSGTAIDRHARRHYLGRVYATAASLILKRPIYDTQCGAKLFRVQPLLSAVMSEPFRSRWSFDVELLRRMDVLQPGAPQARSEILEVPLKEWKDVHGSKLSAGAMLKAGLDLLRIWLAYRSDGR